LRENYDSDNEIMNLKETCDIQRYIVFLMIPAIHKELLILQNRQFHTIITG